MSAVWYICFIKKAMSNALFTLIWGMSGSSPKIPLSEFRKKVVNRAYEGGLWDF